MKIDSHQHFWKYNDQDYVWMTETMDCLRRDFLPHDLSRLLRESGMEGAVTVQARQMVEETEWLVGLADQHAFLRGVVGWVPLTDLDVSKHLERFAGRTKLKGIRHQIHDEQDDLYMLRADFNDGIRLLKDFGLAYDILIYERHLPQTLKFVDQHPDQIFIVDHVAKPSIREGLLQPWREQTYALAKRKNVYCKLSGMVTEADWECWTIEDLAPYFEVVLSAFGAGRLMFGSDWPVATLASSYKRWSDAACDLISRLSASEQERILGETAIEAYRL